MARREDNDGIRLGGGPQLGGGIRLGGEVESIFASVPLFSELTPEQVREMVRACDPCHFEPGDVLFQQGEVAEALYIVVRGELEVVAKSPSGERVVLAVLGPGTVVGEMSLIEGGPRSATVGVVSKSDTLRLSRQTFDDLRAQKSLAAYKVILGLAKTLGERRRQTDARIQEVFIDPTSHIDAFESQLHDMLGRMRKS